MKEKRLKVKGKRLGIGIFIFVLACSFAVSASEYILGPGDTLEIHAWDARNLDLLSTKIVSVTSSGGGTGSSNEIKVSTLGKIYVPLLGVMDVTGMTIENLEGILKEKLKAYSRNPQVAVLVSEPKKVNIYVLGQVANPGLYNVPDGNAAMLGVYSLINLAGGFNEFAGKDKVRIIRGGEIIVVDIRKLEKDNDLSQNVALRNNDTVLVPTGTNKIYVLGEVNSSGSYDFVEGEKLIYYISQAGGLTGRSAMDDITIVRQEGTGLHFMKTKLNDFLLQKDKEAAVSFEPGDIIFVPRNFRATWSDILGSLGIVADTMRIPVSINDAYLDLSNIGKRSPRVF